MGSIWLDPFGISLIKSKQSKHNPPPSPPPAPPAEEPKVQVYYTLPCYQFQMPMKLVIYNVNANGPFCNHVFPQCHCQHKKPGGSKPDKKKKPAAPKKPVDKKKKKKEEEQKKKALALAKEKEDRKRVVPTFCNPRTPRKGIFEQ